MEKIDINDFIILKPSEPYIKTYTSKESYSTTKKDNEYSSSSRSNNSYTKSY